MQPPTIFFSYSHNDRKLRNHLEKHLSAFKEQAIISSWHDDCILPGQEWDEAIKSSLMNSAQIILLLISADFLASDYINRIELTQVMERHQRGAAVVIPIILRPVYWGNAPFAKLKALPLDGKAVTKWNTIDEAFENVAQGIKIAAEALMRNAPARDSEVDKSLDLDRPITIRRIRKQEKIDANVIANVAFHPNGHLMAYSLDNKLFLLQLSDVFPERLGEHSKPEHRLPNGMVAALAFSPTNKALLASASWDKRIRLTNFFSDGKPITLGTGAEKHSDSVVSIAFVPGGDILVSSGTDRIVKLWDIEKRRLLLNHKNEDDRPVERVAFFPNHYDFATDTYSSDISVWDITNEGSMWNTRIEFN